MSRDRHFFFYSKLRGNGENFRGYAINRRSFFSICVLGSNILGHASKCRKHSTDGTHFHSLCCSGNFNVGLGWNWTKKMANKANRMARIDFYWNWLFAFGNGIYAIALQYIPSSIATLIGATGAVWMVLLDWFFRSEKPSKVLMIGLIISLAGIAVLVGKPETGGLNPLWLFVCLFGSFMWNFSAYGMRLVTLPESTWLTVGWQNIFGGFGGLVLAAIMGEWSDFSIMDVTSRSWTGVAYLVLIGSLVGFTSYQWLIVHASPILAATTALVNPIVAMFFGALLLDEPFTLRVFLAFLLVLAGVIAIILGRNKSPKE